jgi:hypothetical protein
MKQIDRRWRRHDLACRASRRRVCSLALALGRVTSGLVMWYRPSSVSSSVVVLEDGRDGPAKGQSQTHSSFSHPIIPFEVVPCPCLTSKRGAMHPCQPCGRSCSSAASTR